jgi:hypothetical protein
LFARAMDLRTQKYRLANKFAPTGSASALGTRYVGTHEQSEAAIAVGLTHRHRGLAVLVRSYRGLCLSWVDHRTRANSFEGNGTNNE